MGGGGDPDFATPARSGGPVGRVAIVGAGQVGTMLGMALMQAGAAAGLDEVSICDRDAAVAGASLALGSAHRVAESTEEAFQAADTILLAVPVPQIVKILDGFGGRTRPGAFVMDAGSAKATVVEAMRRSIPLGAHAIGGHPMAGTERPGPAGADPLRLRGAPFVLTPVRQDPQAVARGRALAEAVGATPIEMSAQDHDRAVALTSHLPHAIAFALARTVGGLQEPGPDGLRTLVSTGFRSTVRLADSDPEMTAGFLSANAAQIRVALADFDRALHALAEALDDPVRLQDLLRAARDAGDALTGSEAPR